MIDTLNGTHDPSFFVDSTEKEMVNSKAIVVLREGYQLDNCYAEPKDSKSSLKKKMSRKSQRVTERLYSANRKIRNQEVQYDEIKIVEEPFKFADLDSTNDQILNLRTEKPKENKLLDPNQAYRQQLKHTRLNLDLKKMSQPKEKEKTEKKKNEDNFTIDIPTGFNRMAALKRKFDHQLEQK